MAKYEREEFYRLSKAQLLDYIEQQIDQLNRFETRFRGEFINGYECPTYGCVTRYCIIMLLSEVYYV